MLQKFLFVLTVFVLSCNTTYCQNIDVRILREINLNRNRSLDGTFKTISNSAAPISVGMPVCLFGIGLLKGDSTLTRKAVVIGASVISSTILTTILKRSFNRPRPFTTYPDIEKLSDGGSPSFPSGHTSGAFSFATSLSLEYPKWYIVVPSYVWASAVAYSRMDLGVHYPSDVLAGAALGVGSAYLCRFVNKKIVRKKNFLHW